MLVQQFPESVPKPGASNALWNFLLPNCYGQPSSIDLRSRALRRGGDVSSKNAVVVVDPATFI
jgi:hypothetical protein